MVLYVLAFSLTLSVFTSIYQLYDVYKNDINNIELHAYVAYSGSVMRTPKKTVNLQFKPIVNSEHLINRFNYGDL
jgi:hypothetical protein